MIFGEPGSGVSTYIRNIIKLKSNDVQVYDSKPDKSEDYVLNAILSFEHGGQAIAALTARNATNAIDFINQKIDKHG